MKTAAIVILLCGMCASVAGQEFPTFMAGAWTSANNGIVTEEQWTDARGALMLGMNRTIRPGKATAFEFLRIEKRNDKLAYVAMPSGRPPTIFPLLSLTRSRVVFENLQHDFPQRVIYWRDGTKLCARVEATRSGKAEGEQWCWSKVPK